ncbi:DMT family transporter [Streptomyces sp. 71268]|uniref:DMT family transporter n=1 Tax=Streptomyces sp. 71268 TaxID=3002640 RepID=UPI0023F986A3|nr:DMT family transporter [Streptomyces sp. 71268]WEV24016.1 DMT family transporter [Streptomyces sp. 71268]
MDHSDSAHQRRGALLAALACTLVGASFTANSVLNDFPHAGGQAIRYGLASLLLFPLVGRRGLAPLRTLGWRGWGWLAGLAGVGMVGFNLAVLAAERTSEPAVPGVFVGCAPVVIAVIVPALDGRRPARAVLCGALLVAAGAFTVQGWGRADLPGIAWSVAALGGEVVFALAALPVLRTVGPVLLSAAASAIGAVEALALAVLMDGRGWLRMPDAGEGAALLWQTLVVTVIGFVCWYRGMQRIGPERATLFSGLIPVAAAITAPAVGAGGYGLAQAAGSLLVGTGVAVGSGAFGTRSRGRRRERLVASGAPDTPDVAADAPAPARPGAEGGSVGTATGPEPGPAGARAKTPPPGRVPRAAQPGPADGAPCGAGPREG